MRLIEITVSITTQYLEQERRGFVNIIDAIIGNNMPMTDEEFRSLLEISSTIIKKYNVNDSGFSEIFDAFSILVNYHRHKRGK